MSADFLLEFMRCYLPSCAAAPDDVLSAWRACVASLVVFTAAPFLWLMSSLSLS